MLAFIIFGRPVFIRTWHCRLGRRHSAATITRYRVITNA